MAIIFPPGYFAYFVVVNLPEGFTIELAKEMPWAKELKGLAHSKLKPEVVKAHILPLNDGTEAMQIVLHLEEVRTPIDKQFFDLMLTAFRGTPDHRVATWQREYPHLRAQGIIIYHVEDEHARRFTELQWEQLGQQAAEYNVGLLRIPPKTN